MKERQAFPNNLANLILDNLRLGASIKKMLSRFPIQATKDTRCFRTKILKNIGNKVLNSRSYLKMPKNVPATPRVT